MKSFQEALEQRVTGVKKIRFDKHTIKKAACDVVTSLFGNMGKECILVAGWEGDVLTLQCEKSIWKMETILHKNKIIEEVNSKCGSPVVSEIKVRGA